MNTLATDRSRRAGGFTLIELMIAVVIAAILLSITVPLYMDQIRKSRRTEAKSAVLDLAGREERLFSVNNAYSATPSDLGYGAVGDTFPITIGGGYYQLTVAVPVTVPPNTTFTVTATAISTDQLNDTDCRTYTVNQLGVQTATNASSALNTAACWR